MNYLVFMTIGIHVVLCLTCFCLILAIDWVSPEHEDDWPGPGLLSTYLCPLRHPCPSASGGNILSKMRKKIHVLDRECSVKTHIFRTIIFAFHCKICPLAPGSGPGSEFRHGAGASWHNHNRWPSSPALPSPHCCKDAGIVKKRRWDYFSPALQQCNKHDTSLRQKRGLWQQWPWAKSKFKHYHLIQSFYCWQRTDLNKSLQSAL